MKDLSIEDAIYICKYHDIDTHISTSLHMNLKDIKTIVNQLKEKGLYDRYRNMSEEEYEKVIKTNKKTKIELEMSNNKEDEDKQDKQNSLLGLNDILFRQLDNLMDNSLTENELKQELEISKQVVNVSQTIINNANLLLNAKKHFDATGTESNKVASLLRLDD